MRSQIVNYYIKKVKLLTQECGSVDRVLVMNSNNNNLPTPTCTQMSKFESCGAAHATEI